MAMESTLASQTLTTMRSRREIDLLIADARPWVYRLALAVVNSTDAAEDVAQEAMLRLSKSKSKLQQADDPKAWMRRVVLRCCFTEIAKKQPVDWTDQADRTDRTEQIAVEQTLLRLSPDDRMILALAHFEQLSYVEMAEALEIPIGTVGSRLNKAREAFRKEWAK